MTTSELLPQNVSPQMEFPLMPSAEVSHAKTSASPGMALAWLAHVPASGANMPGSLPRLNRNWLLLKTSLRSWAEAATKSRLTWQVLVSKSGLSWWVLPIPARDTIESEPFYLPTLAARDYRYPNAPGGVSRKKRPPSAGNQLPNVLGGPINPEWAEWHMGFPVGWTALDHSEMQSVRKLRKQSDGQS